MSEDDQGPARAQVSASAPAASPGVIRHEGAHRVTVAPGAQSALSTAPAAAGPRLRPRAGPIPASLLAKSPVEPGAVSGNAGRSGVTPARTETVVQRMPRRALQHSRWLPPQQDPLQDGQAASDLQARLDRLAQTNAETSHQVAALERDVKAISTSHRSLS